MENEILGLILIGVMLLAIFVGFPISFTLIFLGFVLGARKEHSVHKADESLARVGTQCRVTPSGI